MVQPLARFALACGVAQKEALEGRPRPLSCGLVLNLQRKLSLAEASIWLALQGEAEPEQRVLLLLKVENGAAQRGGRKVKERGEPALAGLRGRKPLVTAGPLE